MNGSAKGIVRIREMVLGLSGNFLRRYDTRGHLWFILLHTMCKCSPENWQESLSYIKRTIIATQPSVN